MGDEERLPVGLKRGRRSPLLSEKHEEKFVGRKKRTGRILRSSFRRFSSGMRRELDEKKRNVRTRRFAFLVDELEKPNFDPSQDERNDENDVIGEAFVRFRNLRRTSKNEIRTEQRKRKTRRKNSP